MKRWIKVNTFAQATNNNSPLIWEPFGSGNTSQPTTFYDNNFFITDNCDNTKKVRFEGNSISANTTRILKFPDFNTTLMGNDSSQIITNKIIDSSTNVQLWTGVDWSGCSRDTVITLLIFKQLRKLK